MAPHYTMGIIGRPNLAPLRKDSYTVHLKMWYHSVQGEVGTVSAADVEEGRSCLLTLI